MQNHELILIGSVGGGLGAWTRIVIRDEFVSKGIASWKIVMAINLLGSAVAGIALRLTAGSFEWALFSLGFLGGFTTFSSMCVDIVVQWIVGRRRSAVTIAVGTMIGGPLIAWISSFFTAMLTLAVQFRPRQSFRLLVEESLITCLAWSASQWVVSSALAYASSCNSLRQQLDFQSGPRPHWSM